MYAKGMKPLDEDFEMPSDLRDKWRDAGPLGKGGQGVVHKICHVDDGRLAAVKMLRGMEPYGQERFRREIAALSSISHPNVVPILAHGTVPRPYYVMPLGVPLNTYWARFRAGASLSEQFEKSYGIVGALLSGLDVVHQSNLVHRDLKPKNVLVFDNNRPAIADFGIVHVPDAERITEKPAGNQFARFIPALYDPSEAPPSWDCLSVASLWAWMLAENPNLRHGNYHWRFHRFVAEPRCEIVRTILAVCSDPASCPRNAGAMIYLLDTHYQMARIAVVSPPPAAAGLSVMAIAKAQQEQRVRSRAEQVEVAALGAVPFLAPLICTLESCASNLAKTGFPATYEGVAPSSHEGIARSIAQSALSSQEGPAPSLLARAECGGSTLATFGVYLRVAWHHNPHQDGSLFSIQVDFDHARMPQLRATRSTWHKVKLDGSVEDLEVKAKCLQVSRFLNDSALWQPREGPLLDPAPGAWEDNT